MIEHAMRQVLLELELISHGKTATIDPNAVHSTNDTHKPPSGEPQPPHLHYQHRWNNSRTHRSRQIVLQDAQDELDAIKRAKPPTEPEWGSYWWKVQVANDDRPIEVVSRLYSIGKSTVSKYRSRYREQAA